MPSDSEKLNCRSMSDIIRILSLNDAGVELFSNLTEAALRNKLEPEAGIFIAESPKVIRIALEQHYEPISILCEEKHLEGDAADIIRMCGDIPIYTGSREVLRNITGYTLTRGVLCAMKRPRIRSVEDVCKEAKRIVVIDGVSDTTNIGAIFRSAAALGIDAALLTHTSCDPLNRRSVRVSMGSVFLLPWTWLNTPIKHLKSLGFTTLAMALRDDAKQLSDPFLKTLDRVAIVMGTEGDGLANEVIEEADYTVRIPMQHGVDSLNVAAASAVAFWELRA